ncbi:MAG TPA: GNAT family N-acetyltransferase [Polyangiaceae bacterium]|nr:GNAT family N-acetyltransferase [Polyangiaceae bacterium]
MQVAAPLSLLIRKRQSADDRSIVRLAVQAFAEYDAQPAATVQRLVQRGTTWVAWRGSAPLGFATIVASNESVDLCAIAVDEEARGRGVGRALLAHVELAAARAGLKEIKLHTAQANVAVLELFLKCGFRVERRMPRYYRGVYDACALSKRVAWARR